MEKFDYLQLIKEARKNTKNLKNYCEIKIAVLGDSATQQFVQMLKANLYRNKIFAHIYEADFDMIDQEIYTDDSGLYKFMPDYVVLYTSTQKIRDHYYQNTHLDADQIVGECVARICGWWERINSKATVRIIQNLYALPFERPFGNYGGRLKDSLVGVIREINNCIVSKLSDHPNVLLNDVEYLASFHGRKNWYDEKLWIYGKLLCDPKCLLYVVDNITNIILAGLGRLRKCLVLDLDNTLWGGIIGEDGLEHIEVGREGIGEAFFLFQKYLLELKNKGIIVTVCSKNNHEDAIEPFRKHPGMVLKEDDITLFIANWDNKADNIRRIAEQLNIGLDSMVFIDDSPFERNHVRACLPEVAVPEVPEDPADYVSCLNQFNFFETLGFSQEDSQRSGYYRQKFQREEARVQFSNIDDYLQSLKMKAVFSRFDRLHLARIVQLMQRSNQFNLTTYRYNEKECEAFMDNVSEYYPVYVTLKDKYGDSGLISVIILRVSGIKIVINAWLMSCRVLSRGVEQFSMNKVVEYAKSKNCEFIEGIYIPTAKNRMVENFYEQFGFRKTRTDASGQIFWQLAVCDYRPQKNWIEELKEEEWQTQLS